MSRVLLRDDGIEQHAEGGVNYVLFRVGNTMEQDKFKFPKALDDWVDPDSNTEGGGGGYL